MASLLFMTLKDLPNIPNPILQDSVIYVGYY